MMSIQYDLIFCKKQFLCHRVWDKPAEIYYRTARTESVSY